jgi:hypothetical protein
LPKLSDPLAGVLPTFFMVASIRQNALPGAGVASICSGGTSSEDQSPLV